MARGLDSLRRDFRPYAQDLLRTAQRMRPSVVVTSALRTRNEQAALYRKRRRSRFPAAKPGSSKHELGLAFDLGGLSRSQLKRLGAVWEGWGGRWGGRFHDPIHFEA